MPWKLLFLLLLAFAPLLIAEGLPAQTPPKGVGPTLSDRSLVFLVSDLNDFTARLGRAVRLPVRGLTGREVQERLDVSFRYPLGVFTNAGIASGPGFSISALPKSGKGFGREFGPVRLTRVEPGQSGEILFELVLVYGNFPLTSGPITVEWTQFLVDGQTDVAETLRDPVLSTDDLPSQPVLDAPRILSATSVEVRWFGNHSLEAAAGYHAILAKDGVEMATQAVGPAGRAAVFAGIDKGTEYEARLFARKASGMSSPATYSLTTPFACARDAAFRGLARDWAPQFHHPRTLQEAIPSPVDGNRDGRVNALDALGALRAE